MSNVSLGGNRRGGLEFKVVNEDERMILLYEHSPLALIHRVMITTAEQNAFRNFEKHFPSGQR